MNGEFEERRKMISKFRAENERDPDDSEWLEIYAAVKQRRKTWRWC